MSVVKLKTKRGALKHLDREKIAELLTEETEKDDPYPKMIELLTLLLEKKIEIPKQEPAKDYSESFLSLEKKLASLDKDYPEHSNADVVAALQDVKKALGKIKLEMPEPEPMITGFSVSGRDLLGRIKDIELVR